MQKYRVYGAVTGGKYLGEFEANSPEEATQKALDSDAANVSLCHQCCDQCEDPEIHDAQADLVTD